ncbi:MAG: hypothetical protein ACE15C_13380 [Phycisphaerae bacterium]
MRQDDLLESTVRGKLGGLRMEIKGRLAGEGIAWVALALVGLVLATFIFDYLMRLPTGLRAFLMAAALCGVAYVAWRRLVAPLQVPMDEDALALLVERKWKDLGDRLISAIQFSRAAELAPGTSEAMIRHMAGEANARAAALRFGQVVERRVLWRTVWASVLAVALLAGLCVWQSNLMGIWFQRNVLFGDVAWPQDTYLKVAKYTTGEGAAIRTTWLADKDGNALIGYGPKDEQGNDLPLEKDPDPLVLRGDPMTVTVAVDDRVSKVVPQYVVFHANYPSVGPTEEQAAVIHPPENAPEPFNHIHTYEKKFENVGEEFTFYVTGGDDAMDRDRRHQVRLVDPPMLHGMEFKIDYPEYMKRKPTEFELVKGLMTVPLGSDVTIRGIANKELKSARLVIEGKEQPATVTDVADVGPRRGVIGRFTVLGPNSLGKQTLKVAMVDSAGYANLRGTVYEIQVQPDLAPEVTIKPRGIGNGVTYRAIVPLSLTVRDDNGVMDVGVAVNVPQPSAATQTSRPASAPAPATATTRPVRHSGKLVSVEPLPTGQKEYQNNTFAYDLDDLAEKPRVGDIIQVYAEAVDTMDRALGGPNKKTAVMDLRIMSPEDIRGDLARRMNEIATAFFQGAMVAQKTAVEKIETVAKALEDNKTPDDMRLFLATSRDGEVAVATQVLATAEQWEEIYQEMLNNRVFEEIQPRVRRVADGLRNLSQPLQESTALISRMVAAIDAGKATTIDLSRDANDAMSREQDIAANMDALYKDMSEIFTRGEIINRVEIIKRVWGVVIDKTDKAMGDAASSVMGTTLPKPTPAPEPTKAPAPAATQTSMPATSGAK